MTKKVKKIPELLAFPSVSSPKEYTTAAKYSVPVNLGTLVGFVKHEAKLTFILKNASNSYLFKSDDMGNFRRENVTKGNYSLYYFIDNNMNGKQDFGNLNPFVAPEILKPALRDIQIRTNWETEINLLELHQESSGGINDR